MRSRANPAAIGAFVVGALTLAVGAVVLLSSGRLFSDNVALVAFFPGSVNGLSIGAPVKFKGVEVGSVRNIKLAVDEAYRTDFHIPVFIELDPRKMTRHGAPVTPDDLRDKELLEDLYKSGLRARLEAQSFVTGVLYVELDMHPGTEYSLHLDGDSELREIPTLPTVLEQATSAAAAIFAKLEEVDFEGLMNSIGVTVAEINSLVSSPELKDTFKNLNRVLKDADEAVGSMRELADATRGNVDQVSSSLDSTIQRSKQTLDRLDATLAGADTALRSVGGLAESESPLIYQLGRTLESLDGAARSVRRLADSLERNPSSLVFGRVEDEQQ